MVRIDPEKYPQFAGDPDHPFAAMAVEARVAEIDAFLARLRARSKRVGLNTHGHSAAA